VPAGVRGGLVGLAAIVAGTIALIFLTVIASAFVRQWGVDYTPSLVHFLGQRADEAFRGTSFGTSRLGVDVVFASLRVAAIAAALGGLLAVGLAFVQERLRPPGFNALSFVVMVPAVLPGLIFGIGYLVVFNNPFGIPSLALTGTLAILVINIMFGNLFVGVLATRAALQQVDAAAEEAAESLGASLVRRLASVVLPAIWPAFLLGSLYIFIDGMTTFSSVIFLVGGRWQLASVEIFNQASGADYGSAAAKTVVILAIVVVVFYFLRQLEEQRRQPSVLGKRPARSVGEITPRSGLRR
jgi:iron(III) transport system permease protein